MYLFLSKSVVVHPSKEWSVSEASTNADPTPTGTERALTLTTKKKPRSATTRGEDDRQSSD